MKSRGLTFLMVILFLYSSVTFAASGDKTGHLAEHVYEVFYDEERVGESKRIVNQNENKTWIVESSDLLFESFFGDTVVLGLMIERYGDNTVLQNAHYLSLYDEYLFSTRLKQHGESAFIQTLKVYELSDQQLDQLRASWKSYQNETARTGEMSASLKAFLFKLEVQDNYSSVIDRERFDYTIAAATDLLPTLLQEKSNINIRVFDPEAEELAFLDVKAEVDKAKSTEAELSVRVTGNSEQESSYRFRVSKGSAVLEHSIVEYDGEMMELRLVR